MQTRIFKDSLHASGNGTTAKLVSINDRAAHGEIPEKRYAIRE
jgi:hypothetical protein